MFQQPSRDTRGLPRSPSVWFQEREVVLGQLTPVFLPPVGVKK